MQTESEDRLLFWNTDIYKRLDSSLGYTTYTKHTHNNFYLNAKP